MPSSTLESKGIKGKNLHDKYGIFSELNKIIVSKVLWTSFNYESNEYITEVILKVLIKKTKISGSRQKEREYNTRH